MRKRRFVSGLFGMALLLAVARAAPVPKPDPKKDEQAENKNTLVEKYRAKLAVTASSSYQGWGPEKVIDGSKETSWFSATGDAAAHGKMPWIMVTFPDDVTVQRLTVLGNREPSYPTGYSVLTGLAEFLDADGKVLWSEERDAAGDGKDFEFKPKELIKKVRAVRFTSRKDEGDQNGSQDIAVAEFLIE
jgi:F5/8 type C domain